MYGVHAFLSGSPALLPDVRWGCVKIKALGGNHEISIYVYKYVLICMCTYVCIYIYLYIHVYIYTANESDLLPFEHADVLILLTPQEGVA